MEIIKNFFLIFIPLILIESLSQFIILNKGEKRYSIVFRPFVNQIDYFTGTVEYEVNWDYKNNKMTPGKFKHKDISYVINSKGFRGKEFKEVKDKFRILSFGGSTTIGLESPENKTYPFQLEEILNQSFGGYEVINMGFGSKSLNFIKSLYINEAINYKPDIITIYSNRNSILYDGGFSRKKINLKILKTTTYLQENVMTYRLLVKIFNRFNDIAIENKNLKSPFNKKGISEDYLINGYKNTLLEIIEISKKNGIRVALIKQAYFIKPELQKIINDYTINELIKLFREEYFIKKFNLTVEENFWLILGTIINKNLDLLKDTNVIIIDPINKLIINKENFVDYLHLSPRGNSVLANEIYEKVFE